MNTTTIEHNEEDKQYMLHLNNSTDSVSVYSIEFEICSNPICRCETISLMCSPLEDCSVSTPLPIEFSLDINKKQIATGTKKAPSQQAMALAESAVAEMTDEDWLTLWKRYYTHKQSMTEKMDCAKMDVVFPPDVIRAPSTMVEYSEIFPYANNFLFMLGTDQWVIDEQYCVNPKCNCFDMIVFFMRIAVSSDNRPRLAQQMPGAIYDAKRNKFKPEDPPWGCEPELEILTKALREAHPGFPKELMKRRKQLRGLYRKAWNLAVVDEPEISLPKRKMKPNEPCSCGSGKKYKKCCGRIK